jgi:hypothetical protein
MRVGHGNLIVVQLAKKFFASYKLQKSPGNENRGRLVADLTTLLVAETTCV